MSNTTASSSDRSAFLRRLLSKLDQWRYALLKFAYTSIEELPATSDLDVLIDFAHQGSLLAWIAEERVVQRVSLQRKSFMVTVRVFLKDGGFVQVDIIHAFCRKSIEFLDAETVLNSARPDPIHGYRVPPATVAFEYAFLFAIQNGVNVPAKHAAYILGLPEQAQLGILEYLREQYGLGHLTVPELLRYSPQARAKVTAKLRSLPANRFDRRMVRAMRHIGDIARRRRGLIITFSGVDGAGKSTVLDAVRQELEGTYRQTVRVLRHRPSLVPILSAMLHGRAGAEKRSMSKPPRTGTNRSPVASILRFAYYFADYWFGQWVVFWRYSMRGEVVLYDRYYFDFIADPRRSNLVLNERLAETLYRLLREPDLNILLCAPPEVVLKRKRELDAEAIEDLTQRYVSLFRRLGAHSDDTQYLVLENRELGETLSAVKQAITGRL